MTFSLGQNSALAPKPGNGINLDRMKADVLAGRNALHSKKESIEFGTLEPLKENPNLIKIRQSIPIAQPAGAVQPAKPK